jgi:hypothetical protein
VTSVDGSMREAWAAMQEKAKGAHPSEPELPLFGGGGGGTSDPMETRVTRLEVRMASIDSKLDKANDRLMLLPTKTELGAWKLQWTALALAVVAIVIGGIIGGLAWIQPSPTPPAPTIIQMPSARP